MWSDTGAAASNINYSKTAASLPGQQREKHQCYSIHYAMTQFLALLWACDPSAPINIQSKISKRALFFLLWHSLSDLGVSDLFVDGGRLHLLQRTHDAVLLAAVGLNHGVHPVRVKHDVVGCDQQHPTNCTLKEPRHGEKKQKDGWRQRDPTQFFLQQFWMFIGNQVMKCTCGAWSAAGEIHLRGQIS